MEGYQGNNSNTPYTLFHLRYMGVNHALSQSDMLHMFFENSLFDTVKFLNFRTPENFAAFYLKFKQRGQSLGYFIKIMQME